MSMITFAGHFPFAAGADRPFRFVGATEWPIRASAGHPPIDIAQTGDSNYRISVAVAGFGIDDLSVEVVDGELIVAGKHRDDGARDAAPTGARPSVHRHVVQQEFRRTFSLAKDVEVVGARLDNGLLHIDLARSGARATRSRRIEIAKPVARSMTAKLKKFVEKFNRAV